MPAQMHQPLVGGDAQQEDQRAADDVPDMMRLKSFWSPGRIVADFYTHA